jgi:hypothetical protein
MDSAGRDTSAKADDKTLLGIFPVAHVLQIQQTLGRLGYGVRLTGEFDSQTRIAVRAFERRHGLPENANLDSPELEVAINYVDGQTLNTFGLQPLDVWTSTWTEPNGAVRATGTWAPADPPRQTAEIWCYRAQGVCHESVAYLLLGALYIATTDYDVERWNDDELIARSNALCVGEVLTINRTSKSVVLMRSSRNGQQELCRTWRDSSYDRVMRLVEGPVIANSLDQKNLEYLLLGPRATTAVKQAQEMGAKQ